MMYKILWFDDEHQTLETIKEDALLRDIELIGFSNAEEGLQELESNYMAYDGVLMDGLFYSDAEQKGTPDDSAFGKVGMKISNLKSQGVLIPCFIYSGQTSFVKDKNKLVDLFASIAAADGRVFDKSNDKDFEDLCLEIKKEAKQLPRTKVRHKHPEIFEVFDLGYLAVEKEIDLIQIVAADLPKSNNDLKAMLANIRSFVEALHYRLNTINVLPQNLSFNKRMGHLSGNISKESNWQPKSIVYQTKEIRNLQEWVYYTCGEYIHHLENEQFDGYIISNYAVESIRQGLLELILWFKKTYKEFH